MTKGTVMSRKSFFKLIIVAVTAVVAVTLTAEYVPPPSVATSAADDPFAVNWLSISGGGGSESVGGSYLLSATQGQGHVGPTSAMPPPTRPQARWDGQ